jgi:hypothetical protein
MFTPGIGRERRWSGASFKHTNSEIYAPGRRERFSCVTNLGYLVGGYFLNIFTTEFFTCFSSPLCEFETLSTVAWPRQTNCF